MRIATLPHFARGLVVAASLLALTPSSLGQPTGATLFTTGLFGSVGITAGPDGNLWATLPGSGSDDAAVVVITSDGVIHPFAEGLPSNMGVEGPEGANHLLFEGTDLWVAAGTGSLTPRGFLYRFDTSGFTPGNPPLGPSDAEVTVDVGAFVLGEGFAETNLYGLALGPDGTLYMTDASANAVLERDPAGTLSVLVTFDDLPNPIPVGGPFVQAVPTGIVFEGDQLYVASFTGFPFVEGLSRIYEVDLAGTLSVFRDGLTSTVDLARDPRDGALTALRHGVFDLATGFQPGTGRAFRLDDDRVLADAFDLASAMAYDDVGDLYVATLGGSVYRVMSFTVANEPTTAPPRVVLHDAAPNPARASTALRFELTESADVRLAIYDALGREVAVLADGSLAAGNHAVRFGTAGLPAGVYAVRLTTGDGVVASRFTVLH